MERTPPRSLLCSRSPQQRRGRMRAAIRPWLSPWRSRTRRSSFRGRSPRRPSLPGCGKRRRPDVHRRADDRAIRCREDQAGLIDAPSASRDFGGRSSKHDRQARSKQEHRSRAGDRPRGSTALVRRMGAIRQASWHRSESSLLLGFGTWLDRRSTVVPAPGPIFGAQAGRLAPALMPPLPLAAIHCQPAPQLARRPTAARRQQPAAPGSPSVGPREASALDPGFRSDSCSLRHRRSEVAPRPDPSIGDTLRGFATCSRASVGRVNWLRSGEEIPSPSGPSGTVQTDPRLPLPRKTLCLVPSSTRLNVKKLYNILIVSCTAPANWPAVRVR